MSQDRPPPLGEKTQQPNGVSAAAVQSSVTGSGLSYDAHETVLLKMRHQIQYSKLPWGVWVLEKLGACCFRPVLSYKVLVLVLTFCCYTSYHLSRKPSSVVKVALCPRCAHCPNTTESINSTGPDDNNLPGWQPFNDEKNGNTFLGILDYSWLFSYAIAMYFSGFLSDRINLRFFLTVGMICSGISVCLLGVAYFIDMHKLYYFILVQVFGGLMQSTGWPGVVAVMSHWFGKHNRGLIMGIWNSHTSVGNILGTVIPSFWAESGRQWGWSFLVPGFIIIGFGVLTYLFLVTDPVHVGCPPPVHHLEKESAPSRVASPNQFVDDHVSVQSDYGSAPHVIYQSNDDTQHLIKSTSTKAEEKPKAINFLKALMIPGVVEYSLALFFNKLVSYTFLFWLPLYVKSTHPELSGPKADWLSTGFDVGGIIGGIVAGVVSDLLNARAITCVTMLLLAIPMLSVLTFVKMNLWVFTVLLVINGSLVNGPYGMITTAVSSDLGTHPTLKSNTNAKATVTAIIDGTGSLGAALGPLLVGIISPKCGQNWNNSFYLLMSSCFVSALMLGRLVFYDTMRIWRKWSNHRYLAM